MNRENNGKDFYVWRTSLRWYNFWQLSLLQNTTASAAVQSHQSHSTEKERYLYHSMVFTKAGEHHTLSLRPETWRQKNIGFSQIPKRSSPSQIFTVMKVSSSQSRFLHCSEETWIGIPLFRSKMLYSQRKGGNRRRNTGRNRKRGG